MIINERCVQHHTLILLTPHGKRVTITTTTTDRRIEMPRYTYRYHEEDYGVITFDAPNLEKAQELFESIRCNEIEYEELPNYSRRTKGGQYDFIDLQEVKEPLPTIPMLLKTGDN
jgi:hypothetical protein